MKHYLKITHPLTTTRHLVIICYATLLIRRPRNYNVSRTDLDTSVNSLKPMECLIR